MEAEKKLEQTKDTMRIQLLDKTPACVAAAAAAVAAAAVAAAAVTEDDQEEDEATSPQVEDKSLQQSMDQNKECKLLSADMCYYM